MAIKSVVFLWIKCQLFSHYGLLDPKPYGLGCVCVGGWVGLMKLKVNYNDIFFEENRENSKATEDLLFCVEEPNMDCKKTKGRP